jgi:dimethylglycine dehydrogenase
LARRDARRYPFLETHDLQGALYDPNDGDIDPAQLTQALAKGARDLGARINASAPSPAVRRENGEWVIVHDRKGEVRCEIVVNAAGYYAQRGRGMVQGPWRAHRADDGDEPSIPALRPIPEIADGPRPTAGHKLPLLRDVDTSAITCGRKRTASTLAPTRGIAARIGHAR